MWIGVIKGASYAQAYQLAKLRNFSRIFCFSYKQILRVPRFFVFFKRNFLLEFVIEFDKNHKNRLHRLKPKGYAAGLNAELESLSALYNVGCARQFK